MRILGWVLFLMMLAAPGCGSDETYPCGNAPNTVDCKSNQLCVVKEFGLGVRYECKDNPCGAAAVDCECAKSVCDGTTCSRVRGSTVSCACLVC